MKSINRPLLGALILTLLGCVGPVTLAPLPYAHPASPSTPAGTLPPLGTALGDSLGDAPHAGSDATKNEGMTHEMPMSGATTIPAGKFQCPMHQSVRSDKPGQCPICGMKLVEKKPDSQIHGDHE